MFGVLGFNPGIELGLELLERRYWRFILVRQPHFPLTGLSR
jgi:hypothetical protein